MVTYVILHNIRSASNVGSIFRTADGAGVSKIYLTGYTPTPVDRFGRINPKIKKTSLGATESIPWERVPIVDELLSCLREKGVAVVAVEQHERSIQYKEYKQESDTAYLFGNEVDGVSDVHCKGANAVIEIPMAGKKESLNVAVVAGIVLYSVASQS